MIRAGDMRHQVFIELRTTTQDAAGQQANTWTVFAARRAAVDRLPGKEVWASAQRGGRVPAVFRLRYLAGVLPAMRLTCDGAHYNILSAVDQSGRGEELVITAEAWVEDSP